MANRPYVFIMMLLLITWVGVGTVYAEAVNSDTQIQRLVNVPYQQVAQLAIRAPEQTITYGRNEHQYIAFWAGQGNVQKAPIIMVHGGCWLSAFDIQHSIAQANGLAAAGHDVYSLEYRRTGDSGGGWPTTFVDVSAAINHVIGMLDKDMTMLNLIGHSAGGHLALLAASDIQRHLRAAGRDELQLNVVGLAAITDIAQYARGENSCQSVTKDFMYGMPEEVPARYFMANPIHMPLTDTAISQVTLLQGDADTIVSVTQARHPNARTVIVPSAGHFDWLHPQSVAFEQLLEVLR